MKKYLALALGVLFTLGFAASAFAIHAEIPAETQAVVAKGTTQVTLGGELRFRGELKYNNDLDSTSGTGENTDTDSKYDGRVRIRLEAAVSKNTIGVIHLESGDSNGSATNTGDTYTWATQGGEQKGVYPQGNSKRGSVEILEAWIQHKFNIGVPAGIKIGHMPLKLGNGIFFDHSKFGDDAIVVFFDPTKELHIGVLTIKFNEYAFGTTSSTASADDADAYVALFAYKTGKTSVSGDFTYVDDKRAYIDSTGTASVTGFGPEDKGTHLYNIGIRAETEVGGLGLKADLEKNGGNTKAETALVGTATEIKHNGYAYLLGASYKVNPVKISVDYAYGSGDSDANDNKDGAFVNALSGTQKYTYVYDYRVKTAHGSTDTGLTNTNYVKLGATADLTKNLNVDANYYVLRATKKKSITTSGATKGDSKKVGQEFDAKLTYKLDKNLVYFVEGGYLWTGAFYDQASVAADDAYAVRHGITLSF